MISKHYHFSKVVSLACGKCMLYFMYPPLIRLNFYNGFISKVCKRDKNTLANGAWTTSSWRKAQSTFDCKNQRAETFCTFGRLAAKVSDSNEGNEYFSF